MAQPLMPKATAVWLVDNTSLTFDQISDYCGLHILEVQAIADGEVAPGMQGLDPTTTGQLTKEEILRCESNIENRIKMAKPNNPMPKARQKGAKYTPISKRQDRPDAIAWLLRSYPELSDAQICRLIGTTKQTINSIRDKKHRSSATIKPQSPVYLGLCEGADLATSINKARLKAGSNHQGTEPLPPIAITETSEDNLSSDKNDILEEISQSNPTAEEIFGSAPKSLEVEKINSEDIFGPSNPKTTVADKSENS